MYVRSVKERIILLQRTRRVNQVNLRLKNTASLIENTQFIKKARLRVTPIGFENKKFSKFR